MNFPQPLLLVVTTAEWSINFGKQRGMKSKENLLSFFFFFNMLLLSLLDHKC